MHNQTPHCKATKFEVIYFRWMNPIDTTQRQHIALTGDTNSSLIMSVVFVDMYNESVRASIACLSCLELYLMVFNRLLRFSTAAS